MHSVIDFDSTTQTFTWLDFTAQNADLALIDLSDTTIFNNYVFGKIAAANATIGIGGYLEHRVIYRRSEHFNKPQTASRCIHLGIDIWAAAGTPVYAPADAVVHSFRFNDNFGDYGPTIILEHAPKANFEKYTSDKPLYTLYGHLNLACLEGLYEGKQIRKGEQIAEIGNYPMNGDWPPHLHFQVMTSMMGMKGDFPGVCAIDETEKFKQICLDPNLILGF